MECSKKIRRKFIDAGVDVVVNADHTFLRFYPEEEYVLAPNPKGPKRIGGKIKFDEKAGFTCMVGAELDTSRLIPPFLVFHETKRVDATNIFSRPTGTNFVTGTKRLLAAVLK